MPGENVLPVQHYPDDFLTLSHVVHDSSLADFPWIYCDRNLIVDAFYVCSQIGAGGTTTTVALVKVASGTIPTTANIATAATAGTISTVNVSAAAAVTSGTIVNTVNFVDAGSWICIDATAGDGTLATFRGTFNIRFRSRPK